LDDLTLGSELEQTFFVSAFREALKQEAGYLAFEFTVRPIIFKGFNLLKRSRL
jgi:hypothetical protein